MGDRHAIVCHGYPCLQAGFFPVLHFSFIQHAATAMDHQCIFRQILCEFRSARPRKCQLFSRMFFQPRGQLLRSDIAALPVMTALMVPGKGIYIIGGKKVVR